MITLGILLLIMILMIAPWLWLMYFSDISMTKFNAKMEKLNVKHAQDMHKLQRMTGTLFPDDERFVITYLTPTKHQPMWAQLSNQIRIYPYIYRYNNKDDGTPSKYTKTISKNKWFYMQLKNWSETEDSEVALEAMKYLRWKRDIP